MKKDSTYDRDYGVLTEVSEEINKFFGDTSGKTVSLRTSHGFKKTFGLSISDKLSEDIMHSTMIFSAYNLFSKRGNKTAGFLSLIGLIALYQNGE
jgi:ABC-type sulfate transport system substrate-binding protein